MMPRFLGLGEDKLEGSLLRQEGPRWVPIEASCSGAPRGVSVGHLMLLNETISQTRHMGLP